MVIIIQYYEYTFKITFISRMEASVSAEIEVSQLPLRDKPPPRDARVAAERVEAVLEP